MHGGDVYGKDVKLDFSVNLNPLGIPESVRSAYIQSAATLGLYPDSQCRSLSSNLAEALSTRYNATISTENIVLGNGASELIPAVIRAIKARKALLVSPCFTGYERALLSCEVQPDFFELKEHEDFIFGQEQLFQLLALADTHWTQLVIFTNPNNPNGKLTDSSIIKELAQELQKRNCFLLLDECFMELTEKSQKESFLPLLRDFPNVIVLRAFTKTFAVPGLRLGYSVCGSLLLNQKIRLQLPEWNVSTVAQSCGNACLLEKEYVHQAVDLISKQRSGLSSELNSLGFKVFPSDANFILFKTSDENLHKKLLEKGILIRECSDYKGLGKGFFRVAVKTEEENRSLLAALKSLV